MRSLIIISFVGFALFSCNQKKQSSNSKPGDKKNETNAYTINKDGIGELKIGMPQAEVEKLVGQQFNFISDKNADGYWQDTVQAKYKEMEVSLYFERQYVTDDSGAMHLSGIETNSSLCKTSSGLGIGDEKSAILSAYDDNPIDMGPQYEQVNDTTWSPSKTKYYINVKDDKYDRELIFHLLNKKVVALQASIIMGE